MPHPPPDAPLQPGDIVGGRYRVIQAVGQGPLDRLYEAQDVHLHERVVVRVARQPKASDADHVRRFEDQARALGVSEDDRSIRLLELSRDDDLGHFAAISNKESRPLPEVLALLAGVDGNEAQPAPPAIRTNDYRFPSSQSQVELESLEPPAAPAAQTRAQPRFAQPRRPKKLETLELDAPRISRSTRPRPAMAGRRPRGWARPLRRAGVVLLILVGVGVAVYLYQSRAGRPAAPRNAADEGDGAMTVKAPHREVQILFQVTPAKARLLIDGKVAPGHSILVPESREPFVVRFESRGYMSQSIQVVPDRDRTVLVVLSPSS